MRKEEITAVFDRQASSYDQQWSRLAAIHSALHQLTAAVLSGLPEDAHVLCVGAGTGREILHLARLFPGWRFTAVEPSAPMLEVFRNHAEEEGITSRCTCHQGYLETLPAGECFDAALSFLVSQFILEPAARSAFFQEIARRLRPQGILVSADLAADLHSPEGASILGTWAGLMQGSPASSESIARMRAAYTNDVAVLPPSDVAAIISRGGFGEIVLFFQAAMIHGWHAVRAED